ncbi:MAG: 30S ribosomal protein S12 methylthiotransferase RimO [Ruminococcus sp.]|nr:30S ribosomal protein S12 methylthiotransferase RimO [Ruminococcus sp.]
MPIKVGMISLGCSKNLVDSERMLSKLRARGYKLVVEPGEADVVIVNTCGFIQSAKEEAIETILELIQLKNEGTIQKIILTGCLTERYKQEVADSFQEVDAVIGIGDNRDIISILDKVLAKERVIHFAPKEDAELTGDRIITTLPFFAYLKIAEGCSNNCSYCAIPKIRGPYRSVPMEDVLKEANWLADNGVTELVVIAQDTTRYGCDLYGESRLPELLRALCAIEKIKWVRVLYCYPERITEELIDVVAEENKMVKYLDLPIQHCDKEILRRMHRPGDETTLRNLINHLRERIPNITLRTTLITGFPGETKEQFNALGDFIYDMKFDRLGCFAYSEEEGTAAAEFEDQIDKDVREHRAEILMQQQADISAEKNAEKIGSKLTAVIEGFDKWAECYFGRTEADAPDIDGKIFIHSERKLKIGEYIQVEVFDTMDYDLLAEEIIE